MRMGPPLEKTMSQPASTTGAGSGNSPKGRGAVLHEEGQAVWFSTREETLGELTLDNVSQMAIELTIQSTGVYNLKPSPWDV